MGRPRKVSRIITIDGEGVTDPDGAHRYTLLAGSHGGFIEGESLSTVDCLDFLLGLDPNALIVGFSTGYDCNLWIRDMISDRPALERLCAEGRCYLKIGEREFWIKWLPGKKFTVSTGKRRRKVRHRDGTVSTVHRFDRTVTVWDVFGFFQASFVKTLNEWDIGTPEQRARIAAMKANRGSFLDMPADEVREYCISECRLLVVVMERLLECCRSVGVTLRGYHGAGALAAAFLDKHKVARHLAPLPPDVFDATIAAYFGGRFDNSLVGKLGWGYVYDINSAYPAAATGLPCLACGEWRASSGRTSMLPGLFRVSWGMRDDAPLPYWGPFPHRGHGRISYPVRGSGWYWACEIDAAREYWARFGDIVVHEGYEWMGSCDHRPFAWIPEVFAERRRRRAAGDFAEKILKLGPNAVYGKLAQSIGHEDRAPRYQSYVWAGMITAITRAKILRALAMGGDDIVAIATDGIISRAPLDLECGAGLGQWEFSPVAGVMLLQNGVYRYRRNGRTVRRNRGFSAREIKFTQLWNAYRRDGVKAKWKTTTVRFMGLRVALSRRDFSVWNTWAKVPKVVSLAPPSRRLGGSELAGLVASAVDTQRTYAALGDGSMSAPYVPRTDWRGLQTAGAALAAVEMEDQPEFLYG